MPLTVAIGVAPDVWQDCPDTSPHSEIFVCITDYTKLHMACALKNKSTGEIQMSEDPEKGQPQVSKKDKTKEERQAEHIERIKRTLVACLMGVFAGVLSFYLVPVSEVFGINSHTMLAFFLMLAGIVIQKHIFMLTGTATSKLGGKDWFYQGFMTFALWFMTWTILLSSPRGTLIF
jgi:hypothetical protein